MEIENFSKKDGKSIISISAPRLKKIYKEDSKTDDNLDLKNNPVFK